jgi:dihydrolipoamide dehydrogenase
VGCIPSKALLDSSEYYHLAQQHMADHGVKVDGVKLDLKTMMARKDQVVQDITAQVRQLMDGHNIDVIQGRARLTGGGGVEVTQGKKTRTVTADKILIATGSRPVELPPAPFDHQRIVDSTGALSFPSVPKHLGIVGGGYIGLELGSVWRRLGAEVTVIEMLPHIAPGLDGQINRALTRLLKQQGFQFKLGTKVQSAKATKTKVNVVVESGGDEEKLSFDRLLVSIGRRPRTDDLGLDAAGVDLDPQTGWINIDENHQTSAAGVYAIGDVVPGPMLAHKASAEGVAAVEQMAGLPGEVNYDAVPGIVYTWPEVAFVGLTEEQTKERDVPYCVGTYPFSGSGRARAMGEKDGLVKVIAQSKTDRLLGVHIIGPRASDMIAECTLALELGASAEDLARTIHGHPTFAEALMEAAKTAQGCSIYAS